jgi:hypothetical protein
MVTTVDGRLKKLVRITDQKTEIQHERLLFGFDSLFGLTFDHLR